MSDAFPLVSPEDGLRVGVLRPAEATSSPSPAPPSAAGGSVEQHIRLVSTRGRKGSNTRLLRTPAATLAMVNVNFFFRQAYKYRIQYPSGSTDPVPGFFGPIVFFDTLVLRKGEYFEFILRFAQSYRFFSGI